MEHINPKVGKQGFRHDSLFFMTAADPTLFFTQEFLSHTRAFHTPLYLVHLADLFMTAAVGIWLAFRPPGFLGQVGQFTRFSWVNRGIVLTVCSMGLFLVRLPLIAWRFHHLRVYELRTDSWLSFLQDLGTGRLISLATVLTVGVPILWLICTFPKWWPAAGLGTAALLSAAYIWIAPAWIDPLFNEIKPMEESPLRDKIEVLCTNSGLPASVWIADASRRTRAVNAYFSGLGSSRRIVLYDNLVEGMDEPEVLSVVAHEVGHWKLRHITKGWVAGLTAAAALMMMAKLVLPGWLQILGLRRKENPLLGASLYGAYLVIMILIMPISNAVSRTMERDADRFSLAETKNPEAFIQHRVEAAKKNLSDVTPPAWVRLLWFTHPTTMERIELARDAS